MTRPEIIKRKTKETSLQRFKRLFSEAQKVNKIPFDKIESKIFDKDDEDHKAASKDRRKVIMILVKYLLELSPSDVTDEEIRSIFNYTWVSPFYAMEEIYELLLREKLFFLIERYYGGIRENKNL